MAKNYNSGGLIANSMIWKMIERGGYLGCQFIIQIIMARLLSPTDYGIASIMTIFTTFGQVFVQSGLTTSVIQAKTINEAEKTTIFWINLFVSLLLYLILFIGAPLIQDMYGFEVFTIPFRFLLIILPLGAIVSMQTAVLSRSFQFKKIMISSILAVIAGGIGGIIIAYRESGIWAIIVQQIIYYAINAGLLYGFARWKPTKRTSLKTIKPFISYGWRVLLSNIVEALYNDIVNLMIGKKYSTEELAFYNRGKQYPNYIASCIKEPLQSVLLPAFSKWQDEKEKLTELMRTQIRVSELLTIGILLILGQEADVLINFMLTEKWLPCVPYLQIACAFYALMPVLTITMAAVTSTGRSDIVLQLGVKKRIAAIILILFTLILSHSVETVAIAWAFTAFLNIIMNQKSLYRLFGYKVTQLLYDICPCLIAGFFMIVVPRTLVAVLIIDSICIRIVIEITVGTVVYLLLLYLMKYKGIFELKRIIQKRLLKSKV